MEVKGVFDTNILIDYLSGINSSKEEFSKYNVKLISVSNMDGNLSWYITW